MAYAATYIKADKIRVVTLKTGSDDDHMTYLNGKLVIDLRNGCRCYGSGQDKATVTLSPGWNTLIAKVGENGGNFGYVAGFDKVDGLCASLDPTKGCGYIGLPVVSNLKTQSKDTYKIKTGIKKGDKYYVDKDFVFTQLPYYLQGVTAIQTAQADVGSSTEVKNFVCFNVDQPATVYILYDKRTDDNDKPGWLKTDFKDKHNSVAEHTDKGMGSFQIFYTTISGSGVSFWIFLYIPLLALSPYLAMWLFVELKFNTAMRSGNENDLRKLRAEIYKQTNAVNAVRQIEALPDLAALTVGLR